MGDALKTLHWLYRREADALKEMESEHASGSAPGEAQACRSCESRRNRLFGIRLAIEALGGRIR